MKRLGDRHGAAFVVVNQVRCVWVPRDVVERSPVSAFFGKCCPTHFFMFCFVALGPVCGGAVAGLESVNFPALVWFAHFLDKQIASIFRGTSTSRSASPYIGLSLGAQDTAVLAHRAGEYTCI